MANSSNSVEKISELVINEAKKMAEQVYSALLHERQQIAQVYEQAKNGQLATAPIEPGRELFETDPIGYMDAKLKYD